jgi:hypothetical protein
MTPTRLEAIRLGQGKTVCNTTLDLTSFNDHLYKYWYAQNAGPVAVRPGPRMMFIVFVPLEGCAHVSHPPHLYTRGLEHTVSELYVSID